MKANKKKELSKRQAGEIKELQLIKSFYFEDYILGKAIRTKQILDNLPKFPSC